MAYPFAKAPTFGEVKKTLLDNYDSNFVQGCQIHKAGDDSPSDIWHFERKIGEEHLTYVCENYADDEIMPFSQVRSLCKALDINLEQDKLFGLDLG